MSDLSRARWQRIEAILDEALTLSADDRNGYLEQACAGDPDLRRHVDRLLAADEASPRFLAVPTGELVMTADGNLTGSTVGHFTIGEPLGTGGMSEVYAGVNEVLKKKVALKALRFDRRLSEQARARFLREARILSRLDHPNICRIHEYVEGGETDFLVLELVDGRDLGQAIVGGIDRTTKLRIAEQIASVLIEAHTANVVHRDLKPSNVMLTVGGRVKVLDFGLALHTGRGRTNPIGLDPKPPDPDSGEIFGGSKTVPGAVLGTPSYMSPEQARGEDATSASDIYSFGLLLQTLFTEHAPYDRGLDVVTLMQQARDGRTLPVTGVEPGLTRLIERMKSFAPAHRPTAVEIAVRLRRIVDKPRRRLRRLAVAAAVLLVVMAGVKYTIDLRHERGVALQRRAQAERLLSFMLGDLRDKLAPLGKLELLDDAGARALEYFDTVDDGEMSSDDLFRYSKALSQIGEVRRDQGNLPDALEAFAESLSMARSLAERNPRNGSWQKRYGEAHFWVGYVLSEQGDDAGAIKHIRRYKAVAESLVKREPASDEWQLELAYGHSSLGSLLQAIGETDAAIGEHLAALEIKELLARRDPDDVERVESLAVTHENLGGMLQEFGKIAAAAHHHRQAVTIRRNLLGRDPDNAEFLQAMGISLSRLGAFLEATNDIPGALEQYRADLAIVQRLVARDSTNVDWKRGLAISRGRVGYLLRRTDPTVAIESLEISYATLAEIVPQDTTHAQSRIDLAAARIKLGMALADQGNLDRALELARQTQQQLERLGADDDPTTRLWLSQSHMLEGRVMDQWDRSEAARASWSRALAIVEPLARESETTTYLEAWAWALLRLDRVEQARPIIERLESIGMHGADLMKLYRGKTTGIRQT